MHRYLRNLDWILIWTVLLLTGIGMVLIASATHGDALVSGSNRFVQRQGLFLLVDMLLAVGIISLDYAIIVTHVAEVILVGGKSKLLLIGTKRESGDGLYECGAVELAHINHQLFLVVHLEGMGHIGHIEELAGKEQREASIGFLLTGILEQALDENAVTGLLGIRGVGGIGVFRILGGIRVFGILRRASLGLWGSAIGTRLQRPDERTNGKEQDDM